MFRKPKRQAQIIGSSSRPIKQPDKVAEIIRPKRPSPKKPFARIVLFIFGLLFLYGLVVGVKALAAYRNILVSNVGSGSPFLRLNKVEPEALSGEGDGRVNLLLIGIGGEKHPKGGNLADTIIIASVDPKNKKIALLSVPRDLLVELPKPLKGQEKINAVHSLGEQEKKRVSGGGAELLKKTVSEVFDLPIHYFIRVDFEGFKDLVNALGGVTVNVEKTIDDPFYPADDLVKYSPFYIKAGVQKMDGSTALKYARSRQTTSDFDRAKRQQVLLLAIRDKSLSLGVLTNPKKIFDLLTALGKHIKTDLTISETDRLFKMVQNISSDNFITKVLDNGPDGPLQNYQNGGYYLIPKDPTKKELRRIVHEVFTDPYIADENAVVTIQNGSGTPGKGMALYNRLKDYNYSVSEVVSAKQTAPKSAIYDISKSKKKITLERLKKRLDYPVVVSVPDWVVEGSPKADIIIVVGENYDEGSIK